MDRLLKDCRKNIKNVEYRKVLHCKYEHNDPNEKHYWRNLINQVEQLAKTKAVQSRVRCIDLWEPLPPKLRARVAKFIKIPADTEDESSEDLNDVDEPPEIKKPPTQEHFNESTLSQILEQEREYRQIHLKIDPSPEKRKKPVPNINWMAAYLPKKQKDRIIWKSKLYKLDRNILEKPLFEQAEEIMDRAAENFADWVNSLGVGENGTLSKDTIKQLFSIELAETASTAIHIAPKEIKAVPNEIAVKWNLPQMSLEKQVEQHFKKKRGKTSKNPVTVAFGRTLPASMRGWVPSDADRQMEPVFPEELRTTEILFKGISHLRSTKLLIDHYLESEDLQRPQYLVDIGSFKPQVKEESTERIPLYDLLRKRTI